jgi:hypothetical protein
MEANKDITIEFDKENYSKFCQHLDIIIFKDHKVFWNMGFMCKQHHPMYELFIADIFDKAIKLCSVDERVPKIDVIHSVAGKLLIYYHFEDSELQILDIDIKQFIEG